MGEFRLIERIRQLAKTDDSAVVMGIGDDAAVIRTTAGDELVMTTDTLNAGVHFFPDVDAAWLGHKALAVSLSDLAAMGAQPAWALLSLSMPKIESAWLDRFLDGFINLASEFDVTLVGGDTCCGPLSVTVMALGQVRSGMAIARGGAIPGDLVVVSGALGDAALALSEMKAGHQVTDSLAKALHCPVPRVALGLSLVGKATACIDLSDGLLADLGHLALASGCGAILELDRLPSSSSMQELEPQQRWSFQLSGGDDYELCFTWPLELEDKLTEVSEALGLQISVVGRMTAEPGIRCMTPQGLEFRPQRAGYEHFK